MSTVYAKAGELSTALIAARREAGLAEIVGHSITRGVAQTMLALSEGQKEIAGVHRLIEQLAKSVGIDVSAYGDGQSKPDDPAFTGA